MEIKFKVTRAQLVDIAGILGSPASTFTDEKGIRKPSLLEYVWQLEKCHYTNKDLKLSTEKLNPLEKVHLYCD